MYTDFRSSPLELTTLKKVHWINFLMKIAYFRTAFLHYTPSYVSMWVKQKNSKTISKYFVT